ncbi:MAG: GIY-YIG nuclease family protein [Candidatus Heimdallarchaeota archaeon]|nr:MAG: GIY-YIG nuclease family protein [Candidatus Heimdallarchaeota archaeon]
MVNYKNAKIYTIRSNHTDKIYVGSTCSELRKRLNGHKGKYSMYLNGTMTKYMSSFEIIKYGDCYIELHEKYPCNDKTELNKREGELIRELDCVNKRIEGRTAKEYYIDNIEKYKVYREKNKEKISRNAKEYREKHNDELKIYDKKRYQINKEKIKKSISVKIKCECGIILTKGCLTRHMKSKIHKIYLLNTHNELNHL